MRNFCCWFSGLQRCENLGNPHIRTDQYIGKPHKGCRYSHPHRASRSGTLLGLTLYGTHILKSVFDRCLSILCMGSEPGHRACISAVAVLSGALEPDRVSPRQPLLPRHTAVCQHPGQDKTQAACAQQVCRPGQTHICTSVITAGEGHFGGRCRKHRGRCGGCCSQAWQAGHLPLLKSALCLQGRPLPAAG